MAGHHEALRAHGLPEEVQNAELEAFVCLNDHVAGLLMHAFLSRGIRIPEEVRIVGIDGVRYADLLPIPLTTVRQPCTEIGEAALRAMLERIRLPRLASREILLDGELIIRQSCGASKT
jgi:GntR family transcriptional regulator, arabinose operon transcriptional repressor